jgi:hypothetical protein
MRAQEGDQIQSVQYVPMLATHIGKVNGVDLMPTKDGKKQTI